MKAHVVKCSQFWKSAFCSAVPTGSVLGPPLLPHIPVILGGDSVTPDCRQKTPQAHSADAAAPLAVVNHNGGREPVGSGNDLRDDSAVPQLRLLRAEPWSICSAMEQGA